jgi:hypothetical protein
MPRLGSEVPATKPRAVATRLKLLTPSGGKPPFPTCELALVEWNHSRPEISQVGKGGLPPLTVAGFQDLYISCWPTDMF